MGTFFKANIDTLNAFNTKLNSIKTLMTDAMGALDPDACQDIGTSELDGACHSFAHAWKYGIGQIGDRVKSATQGVDDAAKNYQQVDQAVANAMNQALEIMAC